MANNLAYKKEYALNAICPYYTMFPLEYPLGIISKHIKYLPTILDPFCGRGTTIFAARKMGLRSYGLDTSPIAIAVAKAKLASATMNSILNLAEQLISIEPKNVPELPFFRAAYAPSTLKELCSLREGLLNLEKETHASTLLRAAALGCLHGPLLKNGNNFSYFSNQMPRTFSTKPEYSIKFWKEKNLLPPSVSVLQVLRRKLERIEDLDSPTQSDLRRVKHTDARYAGSFRNVGNPSLVITSPPYYGMRTYIQDQWLRMWFLGGPEQIQYENEYQICHTGHSNFISDLARVWTHIKKCSADNVHLYIRFGTIHSAKSDAKKLLKASLDESGGWQLISVRSAKTASVGKRQADYMAKGTAPADEFDFHAVRC